MSTSTASTSPILRSLTILGWAAYLACSWTWCIGMYLPVLLVRDFGAWGWVVFAVPNVIGAAAMGWILRDAAASQRFVEAHRPACAAFSWVTIAFHLFFAAWMITQLTGSTTAAAMLVGMIALCWIGSIRGWAARVTAVLAYVASFVLLTTMGLQGGLHLPQATSGGIGAACIAVACVFGFMLCPYLDLTFHRVRQATQPAGGRAAFAIGFGILFCAMIVFTPLYAPLLLSGSGRPWLISLLGAHLIIQSGFTVAVHLHQLGTRALRLAGLSVGGVALCAAGIGLGFAPFNYRGMDGGEVVYRCFMAFYGLVFPAYVWLCAVPLRGTIPLRQSSARALTVFAGAVIVAAPFFWLGFIEGKTVWVVPGVALVLLARLLLRMPAGRVAGT